MSASLAQSPAATDRPLRREPRRVLYETLAVLLLTLAGQFLGSQVRGIASLLPLAYFFVERSLRRRTWASCGFQPRAIGRGLRENALWIVLVALIVQLAVSGSAKAFWPEYVSHVMARIPFDVSRPATYVPLILIATFFEEISYRALFQDRLARFLPTPVAIGSVSLVFGLAHWARGNPAIVAADVALVILDGVLYGVIFARSRNVFASWIAHALADLAALAFLKLL